MVTGLGEALEKLSDNKVDASGMEAYTQQITKVFMHAALHANCTTAVCSCIVTVLDRHRLAAT